MVKSNSRFPPKPAPSKPPPRPAAKSTRTGMPKLYDDDDSESSKTMKTSAEDAFATLRPPKRSGASMVPEAPATERLMTLPSLRLDMGPSEGTSTTQTAIRIHATGEAKHAMLTVLTGLSMGQVIVLKDGDTLLGRGHKCTVLFKDQGISREHCKITFSRSRRPRIHDLGSTNGMFVDGKRVASAKLSGGERIQMGPDVLMRFSFGDETEEQAARRLYETSTTDRLTKCYGRRFFEERIAAEIAYSRRHKSPLAVILFDIDHFKRINDDAGHAAGDEILRKVASCVQQLVRAEDILARYGGEEFVMLVRGISHANTVQLAERVRDAVQKMRATFESKHFPVTVSLGVASWEECGKDGAADALVQLADQRMYKAKREGRNRTCGK